MKKYLVVIQLIGLCFGSFSLFAQAGHPADPNTILFGRGTYPGDAVEFLYQGEWGCLFGR
jgi:hypothetical protein